jgi:NAD(P)H-hydrate epimerase
VRLPTAIYSVSQVRALDRYAIEVLGIPGYTLMERAAEAALRCVRGRFPTAQRLVAVCGVGNNGGDGYVLARLAQAAGLAVTALAVAAPEALRGDARRAFDDYAASAGRVLPFSADALRDAELIVDAVLGTGARGPLEPKVAAAIRAMNAADIPIMALDLPSGLDGEHGVPLGDAVCAAVTVTFVGLKTGLFLGEGPQHAGTVYFDDLEIAAPEGEQFVPRLRRITEAEIRVALPRRPRAANKGTFGRALVVGGGPGMPGAARLAGEAALRTGAGLVTVATSPENLVAIVATRPELICHALPDPRALVALIDKADVIAVGPGIGQSDWSRAVLEQVLATDKPLVVDADALNLIAARPIRRDHWILTPHPGEAGRLLGITADAVQADRSGALVALTERYGGIVVLKGSGTLVGRTGQPPGFCDRGNPGMATAGMGDVLTGVIVGILAQCRDLEAAARTGVLVHALAGDAAARGGERGLLAGDVIEELRTAVNWT